MPWVLGIDEAGYGPNLGPLSQAAVAVCLPDADPAGWDALQAHVRRAGEKKDARVLIDDSKKVHTGPHKFRRLEAGIARTLLAGPGPLDGFLAERVPAPRLADLRAEPWFDGTAVIPTEAADGDPVPGGFACWANLVPAPQFNRIVAATGSKASALTEGLFWFLSHVETLGRGEPVLVLCDKLGGRNSYGPVLRAAFPRGRIVTEQESADESRYRVDGLGREVTVSFRPEADSGSLPVALASMLAKYLREVCMSQFNRYWADQVPGLKPTAGYPVDAKRFLADIRPALGRLGVADDAVWRVK